MRLPLDEWTSWQAEGWDKTSLIADPLFVDWKNDDFRLKPDSPAFKLGFEAIPVELVGAGTLSLGMKAAESDFVPLDAAPSKVVKDSATASAQDGVGDHSNLIRSRVPE